MNKIEEIIDTTWNTNRDEDHNKIYYGWEVKRAMKEFGKFCYNTGIEKGRMNILLGEFEDLDPSVTPYEEFIKEIENETGN